MNIKMNKIKTYIALFGLLILGYSCETYEDLIPGEYDKILSLKNVGEQNITLYETGEDGKYELTVLKGGNNPTASAQAEIKIMSDMELEIYSQTVGKQYNLIPSNLYELKDPNVQFDPSEKYLQREITLKTNGINELLKENGSANYVLPVLLTSTTDSINAEKELLILKPQVVVPVVSYFTDNVTLNVQGDEAVYEFYLELPFTSLWDFEATIEVDESALPAGSTLIPSSQYSIENDGVVTFEKGNQMSNPLKITVKNTNAFGSGYALPFKITNVTMSGFTTPETNFILYAAYNRIPLNVDMLSTNAQEVNEGPIANLIDDNPATFFHSAWSFAVADPHYFQVDLKNEITKYRFDYQNRNNANGKPTDVKIMVSSNGSDWEELAHIDSGLPTEAGSKYSSVEYTASKPFKHFRFVVHKTNSGTAPTFFNMAEFSIYGK